MKKLFLGLLLCVAGLAGFYQFFPAKVLTLLAQAERGGAGLEQRHITVGDLEFAYLDGGQGEAIVLLHGFGANKDNWTRFAAYLTPHYRVIVPDLNGFGESSVAPDGDYRIGRQAEHLRHLLQALEVDQFHLGGSSMGGYIAGAYAARYPKQVNTLLLVAPSGVANANPSELDQRLAAGQPDPTVVTKAADYDRLLEFVFVQPPYIPTPIRNVFVQEALSYQQLHEDILAQLVADDSQPDMETLLGSFTTPTLIIWGEQDRILHVSGGTILHNMLADSKLKIMPGIGHLPMIEQPETVAKRYLAFLGH